MTILVRNFKLKWQIIDLIYNTMRNSVKDNSTQHTRIWLTPFHGVTQFEEVKSKKEKILNVPDKSMFSRNDSQTRSTSINNDKKWKTF